MHFNFNKRLSPENRFTALPLRKIAKIIPLRGETATQG